MRYGDFLVMEDQNVVCLFTDKNGMVTLWFYWKYECLQAEHEEWHVKLFHSILVVFLNDYFCLNLSLYTLANRVCCKQNDRFEFRFVHFGW